MLGKSHVKGSKMNSFTIISAINSIEVFTQNLGKSKCLPNAYWLFKQNPTNICQSYNEAVREAKTPYLIFVHQDVYLPSSFIDNLTWQISQLDRAGHNWAILGPAGRNGLGSYKGYILDRTREWGTRKGLPEQVQTLDELCLITKREIFDKISFDEAIPNQHLFGSDICMQALELGFSNWAIDAVCYHNSNSGYDLPTEFWSVADYLKSKWKHRLPINSTCAIIE